MSGRSLTSLTCALVMLAAAGCGATGGTRLPVSGDIAWPAPPDPPRIAYRGEFSRATDLGIQPRLWERFLDLSAGSARRHMVRPTAVAASGDGRTIFVADPGARCVHRFDLARERYDCLGSLEDGTALESPVGLGLRSDGGLFVSDSQLGRLLQLPPGAEAFREFATDLALEQPTGIAWAEDLDRLFVIDTAAQSVKILDGQGRLLSEFGGRGDGPGQFNFPTFLWVSPTGEVLVTDSLNFRVQRFASDGRYLGQFGQSGDVPGMMARPKGVATDARGHIYVVDGLFNAFQVFNSEGELLLPVGRQGGAAGEFWLPVGMYINAENTIFVADSYNRRVQVFQYLEESQ